MLAGDVSLDLANADTNRDGKVTGSDAILIANYLNGARAYQVASTEVMVRLDANRDRLVNEDDFFTVLGRLSDEAQSDQAQFDSAPSEPFFSMQEEGEGEEELPEKCSSNRTCPSEGCPPSTAVELGRGMGSS